MKLFKYNQTNELEPVEFGIITITKRATANGKSSWSITFKNPVTHTGEYLDNKTFETKIGKLNTHYNCFLYNRRVKFFKAVSVNSQQY